MLYIISTPLGNLSDMSFRAIQTLKEVDYILAEDTRRAGRLLQHFEIKNTLVSYHDNTTGEKTEQIIKAAEEKNIALISDCGTPLISDPGYKLVRACKDKNIPVSPIPGPSAVIAALSASGCATDKFTFLGFLPKKKRETIISNLEDEMTYVIYESPHRIEKTLGLLKTYMPKRRICACRELTKKFEEIICDTAENLTIKQKGEFTIVIDKVSTK